MLINILLAVQNIFVTAFPQVTISLVAVHDWDTGKGIFLFSASSFHNSHGAVGDGRIPVLLTGRVVQASLHLHLCFHLKPLSLPPLL